MNSATVTLFEEYLKKNNNLPDRAFAEMVQVIALLGLSRTDFFSKAAFYGGTALRIVHGLERFSEDLDFSLEKPVPGYSLKKYLGDVRGELESFGFKSDISMQKKRAETPIESALIRTNTRQLMIEAFSDRTAGRRIHAEAAIKVKMEIDVDPPAKAGFEVRYVDNPTPFTVTVYDPPSLFAGKMAAVLGRAWASRVKGRDWYDLVFYVRKGIPLKLSHLEARLRQIKLFNSTDSLDERGFKQLLESRIESVDFASAKSDVERFVRDPRELDIWSKDFFRHIADKIVVASIPDQETIVA